MHMQNFTGSAASGHSVAHRLQTRKYLYEKEKASRERERGNIRGVCVDSGNFDKDLNPTCCDFLCGLSLITAAAKENIKRVE